MNEQSKKPAVAIFEVVQKIFIYLLSIAVIVAAILFATDKSPQKSFFGFRYYTVLTPSMSPTYEVGDMIFVKLANADQIHEGDVITFNPSEDSEAYLTHRVVEKIEDYEQTGVTCYRTKGDANDAEDSFLIDQARVIGTVQFAVPKMGYVVRFVQLRWYFVLALVILLFVFFRLMRIYLGAEDEDDSEDEADTIVAADDSKGSLEAAAVPGEDVGVSEEDRAQTSAATEDTPSETGNDKT